MSSSPIVRSSHSRASRRQEIPASLVLNWQSSARQGVKPLVRRPKTACERCRTSKVKCPGDGEHECERCTSRRLFCRYTQPTPPPSLVSSRRFPDLNQTAPEDIQVDFSTDPVGHFEGANAACHQLPESSVGWSNTTDIHPPKRSEQQMDWGTVDPHLDWTLGMSPPAGRSVTGAPSNTSATTTDQIPISEERRSLSRLGLFPFVSNTTTSDLCWQNQLALQSCQCRSGLAMLIPNARAALQERRLDSVCQVTSDLIKQCQEVISCKDCNVNCTDLICIMAIFQEADCCFEYIAKSDIDRAISVSLGSYKTAVDEQDAKHWRRMLAMQLLRRANELLNSISARGQDMLKELDPACRLGRVNIEYLEAVIQNSRENFHDIVKRFQDEVRVVE